MQELQTEIDKQQTPEVPQVLFTSDKKYIADVFMPELNASLYAYLRSLEKSDKSPVDPKEMDFAVAATYGGGFLEGALDSYDNVRLNIYRDKDTSEIAGYGFIASDSDKDKSPQVKLTFFGLTNAKYRGQGIGNSLLTAQLAYLKEAGIDEYEADLSEFSQRTYARLGLKYDVLGHDKNDPNEVKVRVNMRDMDLQELLPKIELLEL